MASTPTPRSFTEILQTILQAFVAKSGVNDVSIASSIRSFAEAAALSDFRSQSDIIASLNSIDIDRAEDSDLDNIGTARGISRPQAKASSGVVTLQSINFTKIATKIYAGTAAPPIGSTQINVSDASSFPLQGAIYLGRGSNNVEGPINYSTITPVGNFFQITLSTPTTKNHNVNEGVVLAQGGNRVVQIGTTVQTQPNATSPAVTFNTLATITIPDGEDNLQNVPVVCSEVGSRGNVPANSIVSFSASPFPGAGVTNPISFVNGRDVMSDTDYRLLIKNFEQTKTKGTDLAITSAATQVTSPEENKSVASATLTKPSNRNEPAILYIDDGTAYQPIFQGQGFEQVIDNANGGEKFLQLQHEDITKALVLSSFNAPFALTGGMKLSIKVGGELSEHVFANADFATQNAADTFEVVNSINANSNLLFSARAVSNSQKIAIFAKSFEHEDLQVVVPSGMGDINANAFLGFSENLTYSLRLYKNDQLLIKDGKIPTLFTIPQANWSAMTNGETLTIQTDQSIPIQYTFNDADFVPFGFSTVSQNNSLSSWASVFNSKIAGITAEVEGNELKITSNKGADNNAFLQISSSGSSLASKMFGFSTGTLSDTGHTNDYSLNRATAQIQLSEVLEPGDVVTAGSKNTRAFLDSSSLSTGSANLPASSGTTAGPKLWVILDAPVQEIASTADAATTITITNPSTNLWRFTSSIGTAFSNVLAGDWVIISDDAIHTVDPDFIGYWRVANVSASFFEFYMTNALGTTSGPVSLMESDRITFARSVGSVQQLNLLTGLQTLTAIANNINTQLQGGFASSVNGKVLRLTSNTYELNGLLFLAGITSAATTLGFLPGDVDFSTVTHTAFSESQNSELTIPVFVHDQFASGTTVIPPINVVTTLNISAYVNSLISFLNPFGKQSSNKGIHTQSANIVGTALTLRPNSRLRDVIAADRYFPAEPFNFEPQDNLVAILDGDSINESLNISMGRKGLVNSSQVPTQTQFKAYDEDAGPTANYPNQFGDNFDFKDFFLYFKARQILDPTGANNKVLLRAAKFGPTGESIHFGIAYPTAPASAMTSLVEVDRYTEMKVFLASGPERLGGAWDSTTQFDVTNPVGNTWRYTYNGTGTSPNFVGGAAIAVGDIVNIAVASDFSADNTGAFKVSAVTNTYFEVTNFFGFAENAIQLNAASELRFYPLDATANKATDLETYVTANLSQYLLVSQLQSGAGVITTSTFDDNLGSSEYVNLVDGFNAVLLSNVGTTISPQNQFNLKVTLLIPESDPDYTLVGEEFYLVPSTAEQIKRFLSIFAVTGLSSFGNILVSSDAGKVQISSNLFGSSGSVLISGGPANSAEGATTSTGILVTQAEILPQEERGVQRSGSNVIVSTVDRHGIQVGDTVIIDGVKNTTFDGKFTATAVTARTFTYAQAQPTLLIAASPTGAVRVSNVVTILTTSNHNLQVGDTVTITGVTDSSFNGTFVVTAIPSATQFTYAQAGVDATSGAGSVINVASGDGSVVRPYTKTTINIANQAGFQAGQWVRFQNTATQQKEIDTDVTTNMSITSSNLLNITSGAGTFQTLRTHSGSSSTQIKVEKQGQFVALVWTGTGTNPNFIGGGVIEGDWARLTGNFNVVNQGIFKIEKIFGNTLYIINDTAIEEEILLSGNSDMRFYSYDSVMPGDQLVIENTVLGALNAGTYTVSATIFPTSATIMVTPNFAANQAPTALGSNFTQVQIKEKEMYTAYKHLLNITPDPANPNGLVLVLDGDTLPNKINISSGSSVAAIGKLDFKTTIQTGEDSYKYFTGLIHEVGKVIRGQATDTITYPGVAAAGSYIEISAPLPKRIQVSIVIRNKTGVPFQTIKSRVQSAVASYVNSLGVGQPVVFSEIISAVQDINGIQAVSISSPTYNSTHDQIVSNFEEKPVIVSIAEDVVVSLASF